MSEVEGLRGQKGVVRGGVVVLGLFVLLASLFSWVTPLGEGADEVHHLRYIRFMQMEKRLPQPLAVYEGYPQLVMAHHPPFYYGLMAAVCGWCDLREAEAALVYNPHFVWAENNGENGYAVHVAGAVPEENKTVAALRYLRLWSVLWGGVAVAAVGWVGWQVWPERPAWVVTAMALTAFQPSFLAISSTLHNDVLVVALMAVALAQMVTALPEAQGGRVRGRLFWLGAGVVTGLALVTKLSALSLVPVWALVVGYRWWVMGKREGWRAAHLQFVAEVVWLGGAVIVVAAWWYGRNWQLYGSLLPVDAVIGEIFPHVYREIPLTWGLFRLEVLGQLSRGFWGAFGYMQLTVPAGVSRGLWWWLVVSLVAGIVVVVRGDKQREGESGLGLGGVWWLLLGLAGLVALAVGRLALTMTGAGQARYVLPLWLALVLVVAAGWHRLWGRRRGWWVTAGTVGAGVVLSGYCLGLVAAAYRPLAVVAAVPATATVVSVDYGGQVTLVGYELVPAGLAPGEAGELLLYWEAGGAERADLWVEVGVYDRFGAVVVETGFWPGANETTMLWEEGVYVSQRPLAIPDYIARGLGSLVVAVRDGSEGAEVGERVTVGPLLLGERGVVTGLPAAAEARSEVLGEGIGLRGVLGPTWAGETLGMTLYWQGERPLAANYTVFVHVVGADGVLLAQVDSEPQAGGYPTSAWVPGELIADRYEVVVAGGEPAGGYQVWVGMYLWPELTRLPAAVDGVVVGDSVLISE